MNAMKHFVLTALILMSGASLQAQDKKATKILDKLSKKYTADQSIKVDFDLIIAFPEEEPSTLPSSVVQKGNKFVFKNEAQEYYGNGEAVWIYLKDRNEVQINDFDEEEAEDYFVTPLDLLKKYKSGTYDYLVTNKTKTTAEIELKSNDDFEDYSKLRITIDTKGNNLTKVIAFGKDGTRITLENIDVTQGVKVVAADFEFNASAYPDVHVEDLRF